MTDTKLLLAGAICAAALIFGAQANSQTPPCGPRDKMIEMLQTRFKETRQTYSIDHNNRRVEVFANPKRGNWSLLLTDQSGRACIIAVGHSFEAPRQT